MNWRQSLRVGIAVAAGISLVGCGEDLPIASSEPEPPVLVIPYDDDLAEQGKDLYNNQCLRCHKSKGEERAGNVTPILQIIYGTESAIAADALADRTARTMPEGEAAACDFDCGLKIQEYFYRTWTEDYLNPPVSTEPVSSAVSAQRVAAGKALYDGAEGNGCFACHGETGEGGFSVAIIGTSLNYASLADLIAVGITSEGMLPCAPAGNCGSQIADYIWVEFLNGVLTENGGVKQ